MIVVVIIGVLAVLAITGYRKYTYAARNAEAVQFLEVCVQRSKRILKLLDVIVATQTRQVATANAHDGNRKRDVAAERSTDSI